ncbi:Clp protease N-terminal domain-containing protein [Streptomyces sp. NPDC013455]|uniref:Clp protease N-terminal domain-containing protein n=1 Tax=Streptomyces sp. NPDC013455 TaxID=3155605 RepID=UPI0033CB972C
MQPRTAHRTAHDTAAPHTDGAAGLGAGLAAVVAAARRRAVRDRDRQTDTAHLLHALLEHDPEARAAVGGPPELARLLGYLVQRSIGYGLRWQSSVEDSGVIAAVPAPAGPDAPTREAARPGETAQAEGTVVLPAPGAPVLDGAVRDGGAGEGAARDGARWSPAASAALATARARARRRGAPRVAGTDLLAALAADPGSRAAEVLGHAGIPAGDLCVRIDAADGEYADGEYADGDHADAGRADGEYALGKYTDGGAAR